MSEELGSIIDPDWKERNNPEFSYKRLQKYNFQVKHDSKSRSIKKSSLILDELVTKLGITNGTVIAEARIFYKKIQRQGFVAHRSIVEAVIISLYHSFKLHEYPITLEDIIMVGQYNYTAKRIRKYYRKIVTTLDIHL